MIGEYDITIYLRNGKAIKLPLTSIDGLADYIFSDESPDEKDILRIVMDGEHETQTD